MSDEKSSLENPGSGLRRPLRGRQKLLLTLVVLIAGAGLYLSFLRHQRLEATAAFYVGMPLLLAYIFIMLDKSRTAMRATLKGITIALLLSAPLLREGFLCILFAAPIFYAVGALIAAVVDHQRKKKGGKSLHSLPIVGLLLLLSLEGTHEFLTFDRTNTVRVERIVSASPAQIQEQLAKPIRFTAETPFFLRIFPFPTEVLAERDQGAMERSLQFVYHKHFILNTHAGELTFAVTDRGPDHLYSTVVKDESYLNTYMAWKQSNVSWQPTGDGRTQVTWVITYERKLDPVWYFGPLEYYATRLIAGALIDNAATPDTARLRL